jgi:hypothetical protein
MSLKTDEIETWDAKPVRHKKLRYPQCADPASPRLYFVGMFVGSRGSGKTYSIVKVIKQFEQFKVYDHDDNEVAQRVVLFAPTIDANPIFNSLKHLHDDDIHTNYSDGKLIQVVEDVKKEREETKRYQDDLVIYKKFLRAKRESDLSAEDHYALSRMGYQEPTRPKYPHGCVVHMVFDDLLNSPAFKSVGKSAVTELTLKNRHMGIAIYFAAQSIRGIPKPIRLNSSLFVIYKFCNMKVVVDDIYSEVSGMLTPEEFLQVYEYATKEPHDALVLDMTGGKPENRIRRNFDTRIILPRLES